MERMQIHDKYFYELGKCKHYEMKCNRYEEVDNEKYEKYRQKYLEHRQNAFKYYLMMKEETVYQEGLNGESIHADSRYFNDK